MPIVAGLEMHNWSFGRLSAEGSAATASAIREALDLVAASLERSPPLWRLAITGFTLRAALWITPKLIPFSFEDFMALHFQKVGAQTRLLMREWVALADERGLVIPNLRRHAADIGALGDDTTGSTG
jgi:2-dehydropantoate 2-reductase